MSGRQLAGSWLIGLGMGSMTLAAVRSDVASVAFPFLVGAAGFLMLRAGLAKSALELKRRRRTCPSCGRQIAGRSCGCSDR